MKRRWALAAFMMMAAPVAAQDDGFKFGQFTLPHQSKGWTLNLDNRGRLLIKSAPNDPDYTTLIFWSLGYSDKKPMRHISAHMAIKGDDDPSKFVGVGLFFGEPKSQAIVLVIRPKGGVQILGSNGPNSWKSVCGSMTSSDLDDNNLHTYDFTNDGTTLGVAIDGQNSMSCSGSYGSYLRAGLMLGGPIGANPIMAGMTDIHVE